MTGEERMRSFLHSMDRMEAPLLRQMEQEAIKEDVPIVRRETRELLKTLELLRSPMRLLEVGTATGYSAVYMSQYLPAGGAVTTIENYPPRIRRARENFDRAGLTDRVTLLEGDAAEILKGLKEPYDMIFMDGAKGQYIQMLPEILRLLLPGGLLVSDNVLQEGDVLESHYAIPKRNRTIHSRMREYLYVLKHHPELETTILPIGDGVAVTVRLTPEQQAEGRKPEQQAEGRKPEQQAEGCKPGTE